MMWLWLEERGSSCELRDGREVIYCGTVLSNFTFSSSLSHSSQSAPFHLILPKPRTSHMTLYLHVFEDCRILGLQCLVRMEHAEQRTCQQSLSDTKSCARTAGNSAVLQISAACWFYKRLRILSSLLLLKYFLSWLRKEL